MSDPILTIHVPVSSTDESFPVWVEGARAILRAHAQQRLREMGTVPTDRCPFCELAAVAYSTSEAIWYNNDGGTESRVKFCPNCGTPLDCEAK